MKVGTCLKKVAKKTREEDLWFRPMSAKGQGWAFALDSYGYIVIAPAPRGGNNWGMVHFSTLVQDWEIVTPDQVLAERA